MLTILGQFLRFTSFLAMSLVVAVATAWVIQRQFVLKAEVDTMAEQVNSFQKQFAKSQIRASSESSILLTNK